MPFGYLRLFSYALSNWTVFKNQTENFFLANHISENDRKRSIFLNILDEQTYLLLRSLSQNPPELEPYDDLIRTFDKFFEEGPSIFEERFKFYNSVKKVEESVEEWADRCRKMAETCRFGREKDTILRDKFVLGFLHVGLYRAIGEMCTCTFEECVGLVSEKWKGMDSFQVYGYYEI